jgi:hypothetical protein
VILRLLLLSAASEGLYLLLARESSRAAGRVEETPVFYAIWAGLFLVYAFAVRTTSRASGRAVVALVLLTAVLFRGTLLRESGFDRSAPHVFLQGPSPLRAVEDALPAGLDARIEPIAIALFDLGSLVVVPGLLRAASLPAGLVLVPGWNPLLIKEGAGNARFEVVLLFFPLLSFRLVQKKRPTLAALAYGASLAGPILGFWATLPLMARALRLRLGLSLLVAAAAWAPLARSSGVRELLGWPPSDSIGGSLLPALATLNRLFLTRNEHVALALAAVAFLLIAVRRTMALKADGSNLPREALVVSAFSLFVAPQVLPWSFLPLAALAAFSANRGWLVFTATAPLTYLGLGATGWSFWVGFGQYFPAYAATIYNLLGQESRRKRANR